MKDAVLALAVIAAFTFGCFVAKRFGSFLDSLSGSGQVSSGAEKKTGIVLAGGKSREEIGDEIERFRSIHGRNALIVLISEDSDLYGSFACQAERNAGGKGRL